MRMLREADLLGERTEAEAYMRVAGERYRLIRTHEWNDEVIERLRSEPVGRSGRGVGWPLRCRLAARRVA